MTGISNSGEESICSPVLCFRLLLVFSDFINFLLVDRSEIG